MARYTVERTAGSVYCECPPQLCPHPSGLRDVSEYVVLDNETGTQGDLYDSYRDARAEAARLNAGPG